jgi:hypothetical protein
VSALPGAAGGLVRLMGEVPRGPRRDGIFALWLTLRVAEDMLLLPPPPERAMRRRVQLLEQRLTSLTMPAAFRRALVAAIAGLEEPGRDRPGTVLPQLVAPVREALGAEAADLIGRAARGAAPRARGE